MLYTERYRPRLISQIIGNREAVDGVRRWALEWERGVMGKPLLISGPVGVGKTAIAYAIRDELGWDLVEMNASDLRDGKAVERVIGVASSSSTLSGRKKLVLIDDVDSLQAADRRGRSAILTAISAAKQPTILTAVNPWEKNLSPIRSACRPVELKRINKHSVAGVLRRIAKAEHLEINDEGITAIADNSNGDLRSAINDLQAINLHSSRDRKKKIFDVLRTIFKAKEYSEARNAGFEADLDHNMLKQWVDENIPKEYEGGDVLARAYRVLSDADLFDGRVYKRQYWGFLRYSNDLLTAGVALSKNRASGRFVSYSFPSNIRNLSRTKAARVMRKAIGKKVARVCHTSSRDAEQYFDLIKRVCKEDLRGVKALYMFDNRELAFLLGVSEKRVEKDVGA